MSKPLMPPLWVDRFIPCWGVSPPLVWTVIGEWFRGVLRLSTEVFQVILTELTINTQPNTKEADSFQSFVHKSQACITVECLSQVWTRQQWALGLGPGETIWDTTTCQLPEEWGASVIVNSQSWVIPMSSGVGSCLERAGSKPPMGGVFSSLGDWIPWDLDP